MVNLDRSILADLNIFVTIMRRQSIKHAANELGVFVAGRGIAKPFCEF